MKKLVLSATIAAGTLLALTAKTNGTDQVLMTIDGRDVSLNEFEYLYNKNNNQQLTPLTFDEYVEMFVNYKLKVADALNAKLDTTASFRTEFEKFRRDLAQPYLKDVETQENLINEAYDHTKEDVYVSHIMLSAQEPDAKHKLDSIRTLIIDGTITFEDAARANSVDRASAQFGGRMGWVTGMSPYPWNFEKASYDTPVGEISDVIYSGVGYHLVRPEERRPARGEVNAQHILVLTRGLDDAAVAEKKARIDSIYRVVTRPGVDFSDVARRESEDPGSAENGGELGWFGSGRMVAEFDSVAFALPVGEISEPFATSYGYHIIHKLDARGAQPYDELRPTIEKAIEKDNMRSHLVLQAKIEKAAKESGSSKNADLDNVLNTLSLPNNGEVSDEMIVRFKESTQPAFTVNGKTTTIGEALSKAPLRPRVPTYVLLETAQRYIDNAYNSAVTDYIIDQLEVTEPDYANLINEYRDGILLFDISNVNVWDRATKDKEGLKKYFEDHRDKYSNWTAPRYKAYVIFAQNDSILQEVMAYANANYGGQSIRDIDQEKFTADMKEKFPKVAKVERVIAAKGDNSITDYLGFGSEKPENKGGSSWAVYAPFAGTIVDQPEEVSDVRGAVITDYQTSLEQQWVKDLRKKYDVKINNKVLKKARNQK